MLEFHRHKLPIRPEVSFQPFHDATETDKGMSLIVHHCQYWRGNITHALTVGYLKERTQSQSVGKVSVSLKLFLFFIKESAFLCCIFVVF